MTVSVCSIPLAPDPFVNVRQRLFSPAGHVRQVCTRGLYLQIAAAIVDQAVAWVDDRGVVVDPVEGGDRWRGGTAARLACPAAILAREWGRADLVPVAARALDQLCGGILCWAARGEDHPPGVLDLTVKEIVLAYEGLGTLVSDDRRRRWEEAISALTPSLAYAADKTLCQGSRLNNYGIYAVLGEWLRLRSGLGGDRAWMERILGIELSLFTEHGMYRDPGDPMLYDLSVRQNLSELLAHGYDGAHVAQIEELLSRGGVATLLSLSSCGYAPFGGRSNALLHNEAMAAYVCEFQAQSERQHPEIAGAYREAAHRAALAAEPYARQAPLRFIKNGFPPETRHGRDAHYGEYAVYALLAASLFARTATVVDDDIPACTLPAASCGTLLDLWPAFHKVMAACGDTSLAIDTRGQPGYDPTGLGRLHRQGAPPDLGLSMGIAAEPNYIVHGAACDRNVAIGPCWRALGGEWQSLAQLSSEIESVKTVPADCGPEGVEWQIEWRFDSFARLPVVAVFQRYRLTPGRVDIACIVAGAIECVGFEVPCLITDGDLQAEIRTSGAGMGIHGGGWVLQVEPSESMLCETEHVVRANRHARYRVARWSRSASTCQIALTLTPCGVQEA